MQCGSKLLENISQKARFPSPGLPVDHIYGCNCKQLPAHHGTVSEVILKMLKIASPGAASSFVDSEMFATRKGVLNIYPS